MNTIGEALDLYKEVKARLEFFGHNLGFEVGAASHFFELRDIICEETGVKQESAFFLPRETKLGPRSLKKLKEINDWLMQ